MKKFFLDILFTHMNSKYSLFIFTGSLYTVQFPLFIYIYKGVVSVLVCTSLTKEKRYHCALSIMRFFCVIITYTF